MYAFKEDNNPYYDWCHVLFQCTYFLELSRACYIIKLFCLLPVSTIKTENQKESRYQP